MILCCRILPRATSAQGFATVFSVLITCFTSVERIDALSRLTPEEQWPEPGRPVAPRDPAVPGAPDAAVIAAALAKPRPAERVARYPYAGWDPACWPKYAHRGSHTENAWPRSGRIEFNRVTVRYAPGLTPALRGVSLNVRPKSSLGIIGRCVRASSCTRIVLQTFALDP
jgi:ABC-type multidrug transport system fused ATPase/permease subunit